MASQTAEKRALRARYYIANRAAICARVRAYRRANPAKAKAAVLAANAANPERVRRTQLKYRLANKHKAKARGAAYDKANPDKVNAKVSRRRALRLSQCCSCCTPEQIYQDFYSWTEPFFLEIDHILPLALGGLHCRNNLQLLTVLDHKAKTALDLARIAAFRRSKKPGLLSGRVA